ncbi:DUF397 domain-containing protein [Streptomyces sp. G45]|uniref:DUF397 domain-containing protein n=1 Tax=Streptomyces sp. G45 TaxID=3406627 RepID=UPI003C20BAFC
MTTHPQAKGAWFKSSYSGGTGNGCLEVADLTAYPTGGVGIRDSKNPDGPALLLTLPAWKAFLATLGAQPHGG